MEEESDTEQLRSEAGGLLEDSLCEDSTVPLDSKPNQVKSVKSSKSGKSRKSGKLGKLVNPEQDPVTKKENIYNTIKNTSTGLLHSVQYQDINDLISDKRIFLVDGDSLFLNAVKESLVHTDNAGQMLHCIYLCERILQIFSRLGGVFEIVFFDIWKELFAERSNVLLTRSALIRHFRHNTTFVIHEIDRIWTENFKKLVCATQPSFMLLDLSLLKSYKSVFTGDLKLFEMVFYTNIMFSVGNVMPCIDFLDIRLDVSTLKAFVINPARSISNQLLAISNKLIKLYKPRKADNIAVSIPSGIKNVRRLLYIGSAVRYLTVNPNPEVNVNLIRTLLLKCVLLETLPLKFRAFNPPAGDLPPVAVGFIKEIHMHMNSIINQLGDTDLCYKTVPDIWHGNLFTTLLLTLSNKIICDKLELGSMIGNVYIDLVDQVNKYLNNHLDGFPISTKEYESFQNILLSVPQTPQFEASSFSELKQLLGTTCQLTREFCGEIILNTLRDLQNNSEMVKSFILRNADFEEKYHWHSRRPLSDELNRIPDRNEILKNNLEKEINQKDCNLKQREKNPVEKQQYLKKKLQEQQTRFAKYMTIYGSNLEGRPLSVESVVRETKKQIVVKASKKLHSKKPAKLSKADKIIEQNKKAKLLQYEEEDRKLFENCSKIVENYKLNYKYENALHEIKFLELKLRSDLMKLKVYLMKADILYKKLTCDFKAESNETENFLEIYLQIFLLLRTVLIGSESANELSKDDKRQIREWLNALNLSVIADEWDLDVGSAEINKIYDTGLPWAQFQLKHVGPHLLRELSSNFDPELGFTPDDWQMDLINIVRRRQSAVVVAPTSSGKTYASYYCMKSVLQEGTEGIVIYVSPTKALVNQVAATVYARFKNTAMPPGKAVYGVFTRDYRENTMNCQILITVPECLELLLLSPAATRWVQKLRYVIFDEIHCLSGIAGGLSWETGLLMTRCPFLALSATVERPDTLHKWLQEALDFRKKIDIENCCDMKKCSYKVHLIQYSERYNDLKKYVYHENSKTLVHLHPYACVSNRTVKQHSGIPAHISLSSNETLQLFSVVYETVGNCSDIEHLVPETFFQKLSTKGFITRQGVKQYESRLREFLEDLALKKTCLFNLVISKLQTDFKKVKLTKRKELLIRELPALIETLGNNDMFPAIVFAFDRNLLASFHQALNSYFELKSAREVKNSNIQSTIRNERAVKKLQDGKERNLKSLELLKDVSSSLRKIGVVDSDDLEYIEKRLIRVGHKQNDSFICGLRNGIGIHHAGMNSVERGTVEMMFRSKVLSVVFATSTLALGIHMPCKTVVIATDSPFLTPLNYQQMSGRSGRRGFDLEGNVVFWGLNEFKIHSLLSGKLPVMWGNFPMTVTLVLRLLLLVSSSEDKEGSSLSRALSFLNCNLVYQHFPELKQQMKHFFAFSSQLLMIQRLLDDNGNPQLLSGIVTHLHYHEPGNLIFVYLMRSGVLHEICVVEEDGRVSKETQLNVVLLVSHLFTNILVHPNKWNATYDNSVVELPKLPESVIKKIDYYNQEVKFLFDHYFRCVAAECSKSLGDDNVLPLSKLVVEPELAFKPQNEGPDNFDLVNQIIADYKPRLICSAFVALSGKDDYGLYSEKNIVSNIRHQVFTDMKIVPLFDFDKRLNAYAWDFFNHGIKEAIVKDNGLRNGDDFTLLKDFMLVLKTISTSLLELEEQEENKTIIETFRVVSDTFSKQFAKAYNVLKE